MGVCVSLVSGGSGVVVVIWTQGEVYRVGRMLGVRGFLYRPRAALLSFWVFSALHMR